MLVARLSAFASLAPRTARPAAFALPTRRTLFATPQFNSPPAKPSKNKTTRKTAETKVSKGEPAKRGRPPKNPAKPLQEKQPKQATQATQRGTHALHHAWPELIVLQSASQNISSPPSVHRDPTSFSMPLSSNLNPTRAHCRSSKSFPSVLAKSGTGTLWLRSKYVCLLMRRPSYSTTPPLSLL